MAEDGAPADVDDPAKSSNRGSEAAALMKKRRRGVVAWLWRGIFGDDDDFQKRLEHLSKEEASVVARLKRRAHSSRNMARNIVLLSVILERYDLDPAAKAAAASVLASKLGADTGLRFHVGDESNVSASGKSYDAELVQSAGLSNRKPSQARGHSIGSGTTSEFIDETLNEYVADTQEIGSPNQRVVERLRGSALSDRGWLARVAALLVGEDPTQCYALICAHCHMHNEEHEMGLSSGKDAPTSSLEGDNKSTVASSLAAVEEIPGRTDENELDATASSASIQEIPARTDDTDEHVG
ncbi:hypothetical protein BHE74_00016090 [Ensete ventricosum]|uniref:Lunapark zinc ribbon domain-containing protein n=1 Tax=Ensete ventricosum TaxID=4639 RepID=A0A445MG79_ENSVE|nr:hypothetical protein BHE74_00016090 [Ensete ventricosum]RZR73274.1 hypothetical protein BHM03_00022074 [Ensete ventricosum]